MGCDGAGPKWISPTRSTAARRASWPDRSTTRPAGWAQTARPGAGCSAPWLIASTPCSRTSSAPCPTRPGTRSVWRRFGHPGPAARRPSWPGAGGAIRPELCSGEWQPTGSSPWRRRGDLRGRGLDHRRRTPPGLAGRRRRFAVRSPPPWRRCWSSSAEKSGPGRPSPRSPSCRRAGWCCSTWPRPRPSTWRASGSRPGVPAGLPGLAHGPGAFKVDLAVDGGVPWIHPACARAGTVHCGGPLEEMAAADAPPRVGTHARTSVRARRAAVSGRPGPISRTLHPLWAYAHVPSATPATPPAPLSARSNASRPGYGTGSSAHCSPSPAAMAAYNPNYVGGDIDAGANDARQLVFRPRLARDPYERAGRDYSSARRPLPPAPPSTACAASMPLSPPFVSSARPADRRHPGRKRRPNGVRPVAESVAL